LTFLLLKADPLFEEQERKRENMVVVSQEMEGDKQAAKIFTSLLLAY